MMEKRSAMEGFKQCFFFKKDQIVGISSRTMTLFNPIPTGQGQNQPLYECHVTLSGRNRVKARNATNLDV